MSRSDVLREVDPESCRIAKTLMRTSHYATLACLHPGSGIPLASQINVATDMHGHVCFLISQLSAHFGALEVDPRCSVLLGVPGKGDPAAHARITVVGNASLISDDADRARVRSRFLAKHPKSALYVDFGDFAFWRIETQSASLNGGFGKAYEMTAEDVLAADGDFTQLGDMEGDVTEHMNSDHADAVDLIANHIAHAAGNGWRMTGLDAEGLDLTREGRFTRAWFDSPITDAATVRTVLVGLTRKAREIASKT